MIKEYRQGFLDGMRNCGFLVTDVDDENLQLSEAWEAAITESFIKRDYRSELNKWNKLHEFITEIVIDNENQKKVIESQQDTISKLLGNIDEKRLSTHGDLLGS